MKEHKEEIDEEGNKTFTITINDDLKFSNGEPITAKDYLVFTLALASPVGTEASGRDMTLNTLMGGPDFTKYTGPELDAKTSDVAIESVELAYEELVIPN